MAESWWGLGNRPMAFPAVAVVSGAVAGPALGLPSAVWLTGAGALALLGWFRAKRLGAVLLPLSAAFALGAGLAGARVVSSPVPAEGRAHLVGRVEQRTERGLLLDVSSVDERPVRFRAALSVDGELNVIAGQSIAAEARLHAVTPAANPGEWDRSLWSVRRGQPVVGTILAVRTLPLTSASSWQEWMEREHRALRRDTEAVGGSPEAAALLLTLSCGARETLGDALEESFAKSGLAHVLSVSGLHVAVLALTLFGVLRWVLTRRLTGTFRTQDPRAITGLLVVPLVWVYVVFTGWQAPAVRSAAMCTLMLVAWSVQRRSDALNALALAAVGMVAIDPASPFDLSVQLSFGAVLSLVLLSPLLRRVIPVERPSPRDVSPIRYRLELAREQVLQTLCASLAVMVGTGPLVLAAFQRVSFAGLASNVVTLPLSGLLTLVAASGAAVHAVLPGVAAPLLWLGVQLSEVFVAIAESFAAVPGATTELPAASLSLMVLWWLGLAAVALLPGRWRGFVVASPIALGLHLWTSATSDEGLRVTFLSVGQGDSVVLSSRGHHALVDGGGVPRGLDTGRRFVVPFLRQLRVERLDLAVLTHAHPDHALGLTSTLEEISTERLWLPANVTPGPLVDDLRSAADDAQVEWKQVGDPGMTLGEAEIEVLGPPPMERLPRGENDRSIVLLVRHGDVSVLLTGDVEAEAEAALNVGPVTVMKAPHHGSETSSTADFVQRTRPKHVVFCVGRANRFRFPRPAVVQRWRGVGARCHRTDLDGAVTVISDGHDVRVEHFLRAE